MYFAHSFDFGLKFTKTEAGYIFASQGSQFPNTHGSMASLTKETSAASDTKSDGQKDPMLERMNEILDRKRISKTSSRVDAHDRYMTIRRNRSDDEKAGHVAENKENVEHNAEHNVEAASKSKLFSESSSSSSAGGGGADPRKLDSAFHFGKRWRYNSKYRDNEGVDKMNGGRYGEWFVAHKYRDLQREMLSNSLKQIPMMQWKQVTSKAALFVRAGHLRALRSCKAVKYEGADTDAIANLAQNGPIALHHVISVLIYCNFTEIKNSLSDTYSPMNKYEQWKDVRAKHAGLISHFRICCLHLAFQSLPTSGAS